MSKILCSTGALIGRSNGRDYRLLEPLSKQLHCDGFEFMMYGVWYEETAELVRTLLKLKLHLPVMHAEKRLGELASAKNAEEQAEACRLFTENCRIANAIGAQKMVLHLWNGLVSDARFANNKAMYPRLAEIAARHGIDLLVENVVCNTADPLARWCELCEAYPNVHLIYDTKMAAFHAQQEQLYTPQFAWLWQEKHIRHYHVNDYGGGYKEWDKLRTLPIGKGNIDFDRFFAHVRSIGYTDAFTVESTAFDADGAVDTDMLNTQFAYIRNKL